MFGQADEVGSVRSLEALTLVVGHIGEPERLRPTLEVLGKRLAAAGVTRSQYAIACRLMLDVMREGSGESWTASLEAEWSQALMLVSEVMLDGAGQARRSVPGPRTRAKQTTRRALPSSVPTRRD
jgi:hemoglobin-like flavoprotein